MNELNDVNHKRSFWIRRTLYSFFPCILIHNFFFAIAVNPLILLFLYFYESVEKTYTDAQVGSKFIPQIIHITDLIETTESLLSYTLSSIDVWFSQRNSVPHFVQNDVVAKKYVIFKKMVLNNNPVSL